MYETMLYWETADLRPDLSAGSREFTKIWLAAAKVVYSRTLISTSSRRTLIEREFVPSAVGQLKKGADSDMTVGGAELAGQAIKAGLVDELQMLVVPVVVGGGKPALPEGARFELVQEQARHLAGGVVFLRYHFRHS
jgi:dihydrofolate reductase